MLENINLQGLKWQVIDKYKSEKTCFQQTLQFFYDLFPFLHIYIICVFSITPELTPWQNEVICNYPCN
jgi:hypothetical protein